MKRGRGRPKVPFFDQSPEFFEVFLPDLNSHQLCIPADFHKHFEGRIPEKTILKDLGGKVWHVDLKQEGKGLFFTNGWQRFVKDNFLELGDFMVFRYNTSLDFTVRVFGNSGCKKKEGSDIENKILTFVKKEDESEPEPSPIRKQKYSQKSTTIPINLTGRKEVSPRKRIASKPADEHQHVEINQVASPEELCFTTCIRRKRGKLHIPKQLLNKYHINLKPEVVLRDQTGKLWPVKTICTPDHRRLLSKGWFEFCEDNRVGFHDKLEFQYVLSKGRECKEFMVRIIRGGG